MLLRTGMVAEKAALCSCCVALRTVARRMSRLPSCTVRICVHIQPIDAASAAWAA